MRYDSSVAVRWLSVKNNALFLEKRGGVPIKCVGTVFAVFWKTEVHFCDML